MVQILKKASLGEDIGASLKTGLHDLASHHLKQLEQRTLDKFLSGLGGSQQQQQGQESSFAQQLATLPAEQQLQIAKLSQQQQKGTLKQQELALKHQRESLKEQRIQQHAADKETLPYYKEITDNYKGAIGGNKRLDRMDELLNSGKLNSPLFAALVKRFTKGIFGFGLDVTSQLSPETQEFEKLSTDFLKEAKNTFGSRLTNFDVDTYLKTVPSITQSDEGKRRVIQNLRSFNEAAIIKKKAVNDIISEYGYRPRDIDALVDEKVGPQLDVLAEQFKKGATPQQETGAANYLGLNKYPFV